MIGLLTGLRALANNSSLHQPLPLGPHCPLPTSNRLCKRLTASCTALKLVSFRYDGCSRRGVTALCPWQSLEKGVSSHMVVALRGPQSKRMNLYLRILQSLDPERVTEVGFRMPGVLREVIGGGISGTN